MTSSQKSIRRALMIARPRKADGGEVDDGEVDDGFKEALQEGFGDQPLGLSDETKQQMNTGTPIGAFNRGVVEPVATAADAALRGANAGVYGLAHAARRAYDAIEPHLPQPWRDSVGTGHRLERDIRSLPEAAAGESSIIIDLTKKPPKGRKDGGRVDHAPSEAQKAAGNYKKEHIKFQGLDIAIENKKGSTRSGKDATGKAWSCTLPADYGYIKRTEGADGDHVDVYLGPDRSSQQVFIINQADHKTGRFDEHKCMLGYQSERAAVADYCKAFSDGYGMDRIKGIEPVSMDAFKQWLKTGNTKKMATSRKIVDHALKLVQKYAAHGSATPSK